MGRGMGMGPGGGFCFVGRFGDRVRPKSAPMFFALTPGKSMRLNSSTGYAQPIHISTAYPQPIRSILTGYPQRLVLGLPLALL